MQNGTHPPGDAPAGAELLLPQALPDPHKIALAFWMHRQYLARFQADVISRFITTYIGAVKEQ